jgi:pimeloyl-ACP methyl ester carboxylesterase
MKKKAYFHRKFNMIRFSILLNLFFTIISININAQTSTYSYTNGLGFGKDIKGNLWNIWSSNGSNVWEWNSNYINGYLHYSFKVLNYSGFYCSGSCRFHNIWSKNPNLGFEISDVLVHEGAGFPESNQNDHIYQVDIQWNSKGYHVSVYDITANTQVSDNDYNYPVNKSTYDSWTYGYALWDINTGAYTDENASEHALKWQDSVAYSKQTGALERGGGNDIRTDALPVIENPLSNYFIYTVLPYKIASFPNPFLLASGDNSSKPSTIKICADGSQATTIRYINNNTAVNSNNIKFWIASDPFGNHTDTNGYFINYKIIRDTITATYAHPKYLSAFNLPFKKDSIFIVDSVNPSIPKYKIPIQIYRAPILFVHGFNADYKTFSSTAVFLKNNNYYPRELEYIVNYGRTSLQSFANNISVVPTGIYNLFYQTLSSKYSAGKVDIVAHSMGGILSRLYLQNNYNSTYRNDINKLITLNTPHSGSYIANWIVGGLNRVSLCEVSPLLNQSSLACSGAGFDLQTHSYATNKVLNSLESLFKGRVPSHTISSYINNLDISKCVNPLGLGIFGINALTIDHVFKGQEMDGVVSANSQKGGLNNLQASPSVYQCHIGSPDNMDVKNDVARLLCTNPNGEYFSSTGFHPPNLSVGAPFPEILSNKIAVKTSSSSFVKIIEPISSNYFNSGQSISIKVNSDNSIKRLFVLAGNKDIEITYFDTIISSTSANLIYTIPFTAIGRVEVDIIGLDSLENIVSDTVTFNVKTNATLDSIIVNPNSILVPTNMQSNFQVIEHYSNGAEIDITDNSEIQYNIAGSTTAKIIAPGIIEGLVVDSTILTVSYKSIHKTIPIQVYQGDSLYHASFGSNTNALCDSGKVTFFNFSTGHPQNIQWLFPGGAPSTSFDSNPVVTYNLIGEYDVSLIAKYSNQIDTLYLPTFIKVDSKPFSTLNMVNDTIYCSYKNGYSYKWYHNENPIDSIYESSIHPNSLGSYYVDVINSSGCIVRSDTFHYSVTGINGYSNNSHILIYPNPSQGKFTLTTDSAIRGMEDLKIEVCNLLGKKVFQHFIANSQVNSLIIDLSSQPAGVYFVNIWLGNESYNRKIIVSK